MQRDLMVKKLKIANYLGKLMGKQQKMHYINY